MDLGLAIGSRITPGYIPDRNRIVIGTGDIELLIVKGCDGRSQYSTLVCLPTVNAMVFLIEIRRAFVFSVLNCAIFLRKSKGQ
jgi:hypothetical protein